MSCRTAESCPRVGSPDLQGPSTPQQPQDLSLEGLVLAERGARSDIPGHVDVRRHMRWSFGQDDDPLGQAERLVDVVGHGPPEDLGGPQPDELVLEAQACQCAGLAEGLVEEERARPVDQGPGHTT